MSDASQRNSLIPVARAHADLSTYLATLMVGLFDQARLAALPEALADG